MISFVCIFDGSNCCYSFKQAVEEKDHLLVFMGVYSSVVVQDIKADSNDNVQMRWLEHQEVFVLVLKYKLIDEWVLLQAIELLD